MPMPQKTLCKRDVENETLFLGCPCQPVPSRAEWLVVAMTPWEPLTKWHSFSLMLSLVGCGRVGPSMEGVISPETFFLAVASGQKNSLFAAPESCLPTEEDTLVPPGYTRLLESPHSSGPTQPCPSSIQAVPFPRVLAILALEWGVLYPEHSASGLPSVHKSPCHLPLLSAVTGTAG